MHTCISVHILTQAPTQACLITLKSEARGMNEERDGHTWLRAGFRGVCVCVRDVADVLMGV